MTYVTATDSFTWACVAPASFKSSMCSIKSYADATTYAVTLTTNPLNKYFYGMECDYCLNQAIPTKGKFQCYSTAEMATM